MQLTEKEILIAVASLVVHYCAVRKNVTVASQLYDAADVQFTLTAVLPVWLFSTLCFFILEKCQRNFGFFGQLDFLCKFGRFKDDFGGFLGTGRFLDTVYGHRMIHFYWKLCTRFILFCFAVSWFYIFSFRLLFSKTKRLVKFINGVSLILFMHEICMYCL